MINYKLQNSISGILLSFWGLSLVDAVNFILGLIALISVIVLNVYSIMHKREAYKNEKRKNDKK